MQSIAISLLARAYQDSGEEDYLSAAKRAYTFLLKPVADGGVLGAFPDKQPVLQGYRNSSIADDVLSGAVVGLFGVHDLAVVTGDAEIRDQFEKLSASLGSHLTAYDVGMVPLLARHRAWPLFRTSSIVSTSSNSERWAS